MSLVLRMILSENRCTLFRIMREKLRHFEQAKKAARDLNLRRFLRD
jgi:hypothetical protein